MALPELNLILNLCEDIYKKPIVPLPEKVDWDRFVKIASANKVLYYVVEKILENGYLKIEDGAYERLISIKRWCEGELLRLRRTLEAANNTLGEESYLLLRTYKSYPYVTHDIDVFIEDMKRAKNLLKAAGFSEDRHFVWYVVGYSKRGFLDIDLYARLAYHQIQVMDSEVAWSEPRTVDMEGVKTRLPSVEGDILTFLGHMSFSLYEIQLGELLYLYRLFPQADWSLIARQVRKFGWLKQFNDTTTVLSSLHHTLYGEPSPIEEYIPQKREVDLKLPYVYSFSEISRAFMKKGIIDMIRLPTYYGIRLKQGYPVFGDAYCKVVIGHLSEFFAKYVYH